MEFDLPPDLSELPVHLTHAVESLVSAVEARQNVLIVGAPGSGAMRLAARIAGILPSPSPAILTAIGASYRTLGFQGPGGRPYRAPKFGIGVERLVREAHLASHGVLYLEHAHEFGTSGLDQLVEAVGAITPDARPYLVGSTSSCPCGWHRVIARHGWPCRCSAEALDCHQAFLAHLALAFPARIDLPAWIPSSPASPWTDTTGSWTSADARARIAAAAAW